MIPEQNGPQALEATVDDVTPSPPALRVVDGDLERPGARPIDLATVRDVRRELSRVYRESRAGRVSTADLSKFAFALMAIGKLLEAELFEARIAALEQTLESRNAIAR